MDKIENELSDEEKKSIENGIQQIVDCCLNITVRLVQLSSDLKDIKGIASGFIYKNDENYYLISAGHALEKTGWVIETNVSIETECITVCIPINFAWQIERITLGNTDAEYIDFAWAKLDIDKFKTEIKNNPKINGKEFILYCYEGPLDEEPVSGEPYSYAAWNKVLLVNGKYLERDKSYEIGMEYRGVIENSKYYVFSLNRLHQGHDYYKGASGSPIIDSTGKIVSILLKGCIDKNELYGLSLKSFSHCILLGN